MNLILLIASAASLGLVVPETPQGPRSYDACVALLDPDPEAALDYAEAWRTEGGGRPAHHCWAVASLALDRPISAAVTLNQLAEEEAADPGVSARLYIQAAEAFLAGRDEEQAYEALSRAYDLAGDAPEVHMSAAGIFATVEDWPAVIASINALEEHASLSADAYVLRGRAKFEVENYEGAARDASSALALEPHLVDAIVLRGDLLNQGYSLPDDPFASE